MNLNKQAFNPFENIRVGADKRVEFVSEHINYMKNDTISGALDTIIAETIPKYKILENIAFRKKVIKGRSKGSTIALKELKEEFKEIIQRLSYQTKLKFNNKSSIYVEGFPRGLTEYLRVSQSSFEPLLNRARNFSNKYISELGDEFAVNLAAIEQKWTHEYALYCDVRQESKETIPGMKQAWQQLAKQLYKNYLSILLLNIDNPKIVMSYFSPEILRTHHKRKPKPTKTPAQTAEADTKLIEK